MRNVEKSGICSLQKQNLFLKAYAVKKLEQLEFLEQIDSLKIITFGEKNVNKFK